MRTVVLMATALKGRVQGGGTSAPPRSNTPFFEDVPSVLAVFVKNKQNARDIRQKRGKTVKIKNLTVLKKVEKTMVKLQKRRKTGRSS